MTSRVQLTPFAAFTARIGAQLGVFMVLERGVRSLGRLPDEAYESAVFLSAVPERLFALISRSPMSASLAGLAALLAVISFPMVRAGARRLLDGWDALDDGPALRILFAALTGVAAWAWSTYAYNPWFGQTHGVDRLTLIALWLLVLWRPAFLLPFSVALVAIVHQFDVPLAQFSWTEADLIVRIPILAVSFWIVRSFSAEKGAQTLLFLLLCLVAATYWWSGVGKLRVGWLTYPHVNLLVFGSYASGWLAFSEPETITRLSQVLRPLNLPMMLFTVVVEAGAVVLLVRRASLRLLLSLWLVFHTGAFLLSGILFWKWMLVEVALLAFLTRGRRIDRLEFFTPSHALLSVVIIGACMTWVKATNLTWFETPLTYSVRLEGEGASGNTYELPAGFFEPYADMFVFNSFPYLSTTPHLTGAMGAATPRSRADAVLEAPTAGAVFALEADLGRDRFDPEPAAVFDRFVAKIARARSSDTPLPLAWLRPIQAPRHLWSFPHSEPWNGQEPLRRIRVVEVTLFFDGQAQRVIRRSELRVIELGS